MGRKRLPDRERKVRISITLSSWMVDDLKKLGNVSSIIESLVSKYLKSKDK